MNANFKCFFPNHYATHTAHFMHVMAPGLGLTVSEVSTVALLLECVETYAAGNNYED
jgi:hypothetical protein